jgi:transcriptional regulator with XRE-family HTH domain
VDRSEAFGKVEAVAFRCRRSAKGVALEQLAESLSETARRIREGQRAKGLTNAELARRAGVTARTVARWRRGERPPRLTNLVRLAEALELPPATLIEGGDSRSLLGELREQLENVGEATRALADRLTEVERLLHELLERSDRPRVRPTDAPRPWLDELTAPIGQRPSAADVDTHVLEALQASARPPVSVS